jgi:polysaccharide export outer membrane protein
MKAMAKQMVLVLAAAGLLLAGGCNDKAECPVKEKPMLTDAYPQEFLQDQWPQPKSVQSRVVRRDYRIRPADQIEVIYHVKTTAEEKYKIKIRDIISLRFPHNPQLDQQDVEVQSDGMLYLDLVGPVYALDKTIIEVKEDLEEKYSRYLKDPVFTVKFRDSKREIADLQEAITTSPRGQSRLVPVAPDGHVALPLIGTVQAGGRTINELYDVINEKYNDIGMTTLETTVNLQTISPLRVYVLGEVGRPGQVLDDNGTPNGSTHMTLLQAISRAGSFLPARAELSKVLLIRKKNVGKPTAAVVNVRQLLTHSLKTTEKGLVPDMSVYRHDVWLQDGDIIFVPTKAIAERADYIEYVWTRGIYGVFPISFSAVLWDYGTTDAVDWLGPNPG